jgi:RNA recognition motif-containing protein
MASPEDAQRTIEQFHGYDMGGRVLTVNEARDREERPARTFDSGGRRDFAGSDRGSCRNERNHR